MEQMTNSKTNYLTKIVVLLNLPVPVLYFSFILLLKLNLFPESFKDEIYYNGMLFWMPQLLFFIIGSLIIRKKKIIIIIAIIFVVLFFSEVLTLEVFSPGV